MVVQGQMTLGHIFILIDLLFLEYCRGWVLGPFLIVVPLNDFSFSMPCDPVVYSNNTILINYSFWKLDIRTLEQNNSMKKALEWMVQANSFKVNDSKTEI